jgi:undecaprenyl-diphosphatase
MSWWKALVLAVVQGLTEFLPVSSSAHLVIAEKLLGGLQDRGLAFEVVVHLGTLAAVLWYFRRDLACLLGWSEASPFHGCQTKVLGMVLLASVPTGAIGLLFKSLVEKSFESTGFAGLMLLVTSAFLYGASRMPGSGVEAKNMRAWQALAVGVAQGIAVFPGISRSGATVSAALFAGLDRGLAFRFSFLLFIPAMLGATALEAPDIAADMAASGSSVPIYLASFAVSGVTGYFALKIFARVLREMKLVYFSWYCLFAAGAGLAVHWMK